MQTKAINAPDAPKAAGGYAQAIEVTGASKLLFISGQIPATVDGTVPPDFASQARLVWANLEAQLRGAGLTLRDLVKVTVYLASRDHALANRAVRQEVLGGHAPAMTVVIAGIFDSAWLLEIEAFAAA